MTLHFSLAFATVMWLLRDIDTTYDSPPLNNLFHPICLRRAHVHNIDRSIYVHVYGVDSEIPTRILGTLVHAFTTRLQSWIIRVTRRNHPNYKSNDDMLLWTNLCVKPVITVRRTHSMISPYNTLLSHNLDNACRDFCLSHCAANVWPCATRAAKKMYNAPAPSALCRWKENTHKGIRALISAFHHLHAPFLCHSAGNALE